MIKVLEARYLDEHRIELVFSDGKEGVFDASALLLRTGALVEALRDESYFKRLYIDAGALCWPNGLELAPSRLYENCMATTLLIRHAINVIPVRPEWNIRPQVERRWQETGRSCGRVHGCCFRTKTD
jgi:hypothetical protein